VLNEINIITEGYMQNILATAVLIELFRLFISHARGINDSTAYNRAGKQQLCSSSMIINSEFPVDLFCINTVKRPVEVSYDTFKVTYKRSICFYTYTKILYTTTRQS